MSAFCTFPAHTTSLGKFCLQRKNDWSNTVQSAIMACRIFWSGAGRPSTGRISESCWSNAAAVAWKNFCGSHMLFCHQWYRTHDKSHPFASRAVDSIFEKMNVLFLLNQVLHHPHGNSVAVLFGRERAFRRFDSTLCHRVV